MPSKDLVTIDGTMTSKDALEYFEEPGKFIFKWEEDPEEISRRIDAATARASSAAELFGQEEVLKAQQMIGRPLHFYSVEWRPSDVGEDNQDGGGLPFYGLFRVADVNGETRLMSCGAKNVVLKAAKASAEGWFPLWLKIVEVQVKNPVKGRKPPLDLIAAEAPTLDSEGKVF
jgi:hypothetical protein